MATLEISASDREDPDATRCPGRLAPQPEALATDSGAVSADDPDATRDPHATFDPNATRDPDVTRQPAVASPQAYAPPSKPHTTPGEPGVGRVLGKRYRLEQLLGAGGMGVVYRASDLQVPGESFAIKVLKPTLQGHADLVQALREEVRKTRTLSHPNIVAAYSVSSDEDGDYMLMEYLEGQTLQKLLDEEFGRGIPFARAWPLIMDACAGLAYAHDHSVIHSDLKPSNVFVTSGGKVKLLDFGIARVARGPIRGFDAAAFGAATESYASCEMLEGAAPDVRDDVYSLGCVVYEMLSGKHPFDRRAATEARDLGISPPPLGALSRRQNAAIARALAFDRQQRTDSVEAFEAELEPARSPPRSMLIAAATLVAVLIAAVVLFDRRTQAPLPVTRTPVATSGPALPAVQALAQKAAALGIDPSDSLLKVGRHALEQAKASIRAGKLAEAAPALDEAEGSLREAIRISPRIALVGSTAAEIETALQLCRQEMANSPDCTPAALADERARQVTLRPFALDTAAATNAEFEDFVRHTNYVTAAERAKGVYAAAEHAQLLPGWSWKTLREWQLPAGADAADYPVRGIDYATAKAYCAWRGKRLPSEDEWEFAARGPARRVFPWGNGAAEEPETGAGVFAAVSSERPTGYFGGKGLGGALWEWAEGAADGNPILRGPSYLVRVPFYQRLATRASENPLHARVDTGVRCASSTEAWPDVASTSH